jgi:uncharacterized membrane protein YkvA (DUF1232 family)
MAATKKTVKKIAKKSGAKKAAKKSPAKKPAAKLTAAQAAMLKKMYTDALKQVGPLDAGYAVRSTPTKLQGLCASPENEDFKHRVRLLHQALRDSTKNKFKLSAQAFSAITAALVYVLNPFDLIPDHMEGKGHLDDNFILDLAYQDAKADLKKYCLAKKLDPAGYGL